MAVPVRSVSDLRDNPKTINLQSLERTERMMARWMCGVSVAKGYETYSLLGVQSVADVVRPGRLRWFGYLEPSSVDDWAQPCNSRY